MGVAPHQLLVCEAGAAGAFSERINKTIKGETRDANGRKQDTEESGFVDLARMGLSKACVAQVVATAARVTEHLTCLFPTSVTHHRDSNVFIDVSFEVLLHDCEDGVVA